jgi:hypothetical protein
MNLRPFQPGASPCGTACPLEWAAPAFAVPMGEPIPMTLPAGSVLHGMSYARDDIPYASSQGYFTLRDHHGQGYRLPNGRVMFQFWECGNWAPATIMETSNAHPMGQLLGAPAPHQQPWTASPLASLRAYRDSGIVMVQPDDPYRDAGGAIPPVPLPSSLTLMIGSLVCLFLLRRQ